MGGSIKQSLEVHKGIIHCVKYVKDPTSGSDALISGGADLTVKFLKPDTLEQLKSFVVDAIPRSVDYSRFLLVGLRNGSIFEYDITNNAKECIMQSHHDGESWGLVVIEGENKYITSGDDNKILMYDLIQKKVI
jgi:WD40 repeat protein